MVPIKTTVPAVTCTVQSTYLTGTYPNEHGIVGNGWYFRDECEVKFRQQGWIAIREELGRELLDAGASSAFAVADHQIAHIYVRDPAKLAEVKALVARTPGVGEVLDAKGKKAYKLDHPRSGELVALAEPDAWFTYYYWLDDERAPDFARTVDIHRKPGYDPVELFTDPQISFLMAKIALTLAKKKLGFRYLMDVIPLDSSLVRGSHGSLTAPEEGPLFITQQTELLEEQMVKATAVHDLILGHLQMERGRRP